MSKIAKLLMLCDSGKGGKMAGKNLDEISLEGERVYDSSVNKILRQYDVYIQVIE